MMSSAPTIVESRCAMTSEVRLRDTRSSASWISCSVWLSSAEAEVAIPSVAREVSDVTGAGDTVIATLALVLAAIGLYGVTAHTVAGRTGEIGIRMALGATRGGVVTMILRGVIAQVAWGVAIGVPAALAGGRILADQRFGVKSSDPVTLTVVTGGLGLAALLAGFLPALRASSIDPVQALRGD